MGGVTNFVVKISVPVLGSVPKNQLLYKLLANISRGRNGVIAPCKGLKEGSGAEERN